MADYTTNVNVNVNNKAVENASDNAAKKVEKLGNAAKENASKVERSGNKVKNALEGLMTSGTGGFGGLAKAIGPLAVTVAATYKVFKTLVDVSKELAQQWKDNLKLTDDIAQRQESQRIKQVSDKEGKDITASEYEAAKANLDRTNSERESEEQRLQQIERELNQPKTPTGLIGGAWSKLTSTLGLNSDEDRRKELIEERDRLLQRQRNRESNAGGYESIIDKYEKNIGGQIVEALNNDNAFVNAVDALTGPLENLTKDEQEGEYKLYQSEDINGYSLGPKIGKQSEQLNSFMNAMDKMGLYMSNNAFSQMKNPELDIMKEQKDILEKIEENTQDFAATYAD